MQKVREHNFIPHIRQPRKTPVTAIWHWWIVTPGTHMGVTSVCSHGRHMQSCHRNWHAFHNLDYWIRDGTFFPALGSQHWSLTHLACTPGPTTPVWRFKSSKEHLGPIRIDARLNPGCPGLKCLSQCICNWHSKFQWLTNLEVCTPVWKSELEGIAWKEILSIKLLCSK